MATGMVGSKCSESITRICPAPPVLAPLSQRFYPHGIKIANIAFVYILVGSRPVGKRICLFSDIPNKRFSAFLTKA